VKERLFPLKPKSHACDPLKSRPDPDFSSEVDFFTVLWEA
jgi:hypothetical protein